ncbi:hypothetical protein [Solidesulfovibrio sp.]|jgi:hypothetical protein|uniref:hypothetical protein n=1 Tax=Solidesulfovibrio sp. TaxID=2910990 RepID=UPI002B208206|nr:hypothetical protein [Solidesulfovibrio sp.]MEA5087550.1 hypothetical protein [Solidesulfovibrio sp.]HML63150.1 hypothetical protein [Solidesulfovibrio sp.]
MSGGKETDIAREAEALEQEMATVAEKKIAVEKRVRELMASEDPRAGVSYAQEIFAAKQEKLTLATQHEVLRRRRNRLLMEL